MVMLPLGGRIASSPAAAPKAAPSAGKLTARLAATRLAPVQAGEIRLNYHFRRASSRFSYLLERNQHGRWTALRAVALKGSFTGSHVSTVKELFGEKPVEAGSYRLLLSSDRNQVSLRFTIFAAEPITGATGISAGGKLTCILVDGGGVKCWGNNFNGELGNGSMKNSSTPVLVGGILGAIAVNSGYEHSCVVFPGGTVSCWGTNHIGELGDGTLMSSPTPISVGGLGGVVASSSGAAHTCALLADGSLYCWGDNEAGQLGVNSFNRRPPFGISNPTRVDAVSNAVGVSAGFINTCALISGGSIECWGYNYDGQVGNGTVNRKRPYAVPSPAHVTGITSAVSISAGAFHTCALIAGGTVKCWGYVKAGGLLAKPLLHTSVPKQVPGIADAVSISSGGFHNCALLADGTVKCWGANQFGQLGNGKLVDSIKPVTVIGVKHAVSISSGALHTCAVLSGGAVKCWGSNDEGELGTGSLSQSARPLTVVQPTR